MNHWYVYHSKKTMGHSYESLGESAVYSATEQPKLCIGDVVWVVEGGDSDPMTFSLVDCFRYTAAAYPPFSADYMRFKMKVAGSSLLGGRRVLLDNSFDWFRDLHTKYITKQRFFVRLHNDESIQKGLLDVSTVVI